MNLLPPAYLDTCPELPADASLGHPHLIDCSQPTVSKDHKLADVVAAILYNWNPDALQAFLYLGKERFIFKIEQAAGSKQIDSVIARTGNTVVFGGYKTRTDSSGKISHDWHCHIHYEIHKSGIWVPKFAIDRGFGGSLLDEAVMRDESKYGEYGAGRGTRGGLKHWRTSTARRCF